MKTYNLGLSLLLLIIGAQSLSCASKMTSNSNESDSACVLEESTKIHSRTDTIFDLLKSVYPDFFLDASLRNDTIFVNQDFLLFDDAKKKSFEEVLDNGDIEDMFSMKYENQLPPIYLMDAGRSRCESLFKLMYGRSESEVKNNLIRVHWFGQNLMFNKNNGAADSLRSVMKELSMRNDLLKYTKSAGTFYWRKVRGANRLSAHSYGIAIDIGLDYSNYWRWDNPKVGELDSISYKNRLPLEIVNIFERHGFIWGGKWYHYDTMHFEYRPEIIEYNKHL